MPRKRKAVQGYPYTIPSIDEKRIKPKLRPMEAEQFLLVEALLRTPKIIEMFERDRPAFHAYWNNYCGILSRAPLDGSHHALVIHDEALAQRFLELGYVDIGLGIFDLGIEARLPSGTTAQHGSIVLYGPIADGAAMSALRLQDRNPRYLQLHLDVSHPPQAILERLGPLLKARNKALHPGPSAGRFTHEAVPKSQIVTQLKYFRCYDLQRPPYNYTIQQIANIVYRDPRNTKGSAEGNTQQALTRARAMIEKAAATIQLPRTLQ